MVDKKIEIHTYDDTHVVTRGCAKMLDDLLRRYPEKKISLLLSGGSALEVFSAMDEKLFDSSVSLFLVDERYGVSSVDQNYAQLLDLDFTKEVQSRGCQVIDPAIQNLSSVENAAIAYEQKLKSVINDDAIIITLLGVGSDGHTAGIMPYPEDEEYFRATFCDSNRFAVGYDAGEKNQFPFRVTLSASLLMHRSNHAVVYAVGESKRSVLEEIVQQEEPLHVYPARVIHHMSDVHLFSDQKL